MATNQKRNATILVLVLAIIIVLVGISGIYGSPIERSSFVCREADGTVHTEESVWGCGWLIDWKYCNKGSYVDNTCVELED